MPRRKVGGDTRLSTPANTAKAFDVAERQRKAVELRRAGHTFDEIATMLGFVDRSHAHKAVMSALKSVPKDEADQLRVLEVERLDFMLKVLEPAVSVGDVEAIDRALKVAARRAKLLGLDAPAKTETKVEGGATVAAVTPADAKRIMAELFGSQAAPKHSASEGNNDGSEPAGDSSGDQS